MATKFLRLPEVLNRTGLSRSTIYQLIRDGKFPPPVALGGRAKGWVEEEIEAALEGMIKSSRDFR